LYFTTEIRSVLFIVGILNNNTTQTHSGAVYSWFAHIYLHQLSIGSLSSLKTRVLLFLAFTLRFQTNKVFVFYNYSLFLPGAKSPYDTGKISITTSGGRIKRSQAITNIVRSLRSASDGKFVALSRISDTLLVLWYLLTDASASKHGIIIIIIINGLFSQIGDRCLL
jgi:hypothetical protein